MVESANDGIISADSRGVIVSLNRSAELLFGYTEDELKDQSLSVLMPERFRAGHRAGISRIAGGAPSDLAGHVTELLGLRRNGSEFPMELSLAFWFWNGERFFTGTVRDITERKEAEARVRREGARAKALVRVAARLNSHLDLPDTLSAVCEEAAVATGADFSMVSLLDERRGVLVPSCAAGPRPPDAPTLAAMAWNVSPHGSDPADVRSLDIRAPNTDVANPGGWTGARHFAVTPLRTADRPIGTLSVASSLPNHAFAEDQREVLRGIADQAAQAIRNARLFEELSVAYDATLEGWSRAMDLRDRETEGHTQRVTDVSVRLARGPGAVRRTRS